MNIAAYCRVSTDKEDQLNSLEAQKKFFTEYTQNNNHNLVGLYADEGISGTKIKNRTEFQKLMRDAQKGLFEMVVVKDISRFARNTVDFLQSIRQLKALNIETVFLTANQTVLGNSEFILTIFGALAQEESANTSKRIKFGKKINAEKGRVPNLVYGYNKISGEYFTLEINREEAQTVREIFDLYINEEMGTARIANTLNERGIKTKRGCNWTQNAVARILTNRIYVGQIVNGKEEIQDFLTSKRRKKDETDWYVVNRPELRIVSDEIFERAERILETRQNAFVNNHERHSSKHLFSTLIKCKECGYSFRRMCYRGCYRWVCSVRNTQGASVCPNAVILDEQLLIDNLQNYFSGILKNKDTMIKNIVSEFNRVYNEKADNELRGAELEKKQSDLEKRRQKYMDMYVDELISRDELNTKLKSINSELEQVRGELSVAEYNLSRGEMLDDILGKTFSGIEQITDISAMSNAQLKKIINRIEVDKDGHIDIFFNLFSEIGLDETFLICDNHT
ncbi:MAG: recombinase family protein [Prevotella sp.]|nr:recombinase family protein [Prevotella sp.]